MSPNGGTNNYLESSLEFSVGKKTKFALFCQGEKNQKIKQNCPSERLFYSHYGITDFLETIIIQY